MNLIEANNIYVFVLLSYLPSPHRRGLVKDFPSSVRIHRDILMSLFIRLLQGSVKFWKHRKKWEVALLLNCKSSVDL